MLGKNAGKSQKIVAGCNSAAFEDDFLKKWINGLEKN